MLIGLTGKAGSGKDESYRFIEAWARDSYRPVRRDAFADRLKWSAARIFLPEISREDAVEWCNLLKLEVGFRRSVAVKDDMGDLISVSGRQYLQRYGTEAHREIFGDNFWIHAVLDQADPDILTVITDVRFPNEARAIKNYAGQIWQITRPGEVIIESDHPSEQDLPAELIDCVIVNDGDLEDLRAMVRSLIERVAV